MENEIRLKMRRERLSERITLCVEPSLKDLYDECMSSADVAGDVREYLRSRLLQIREQIRQVQAQQAG
jgi:hypothetical protein